MPETDDVRHDIDLQETRRRFLFAREQAAQASTERYRAICDMRQWPTHRSDDG